MNLLLVEDDARIAAFVRKGLTARGHTVERVATGEDALLRLVLPAAPYALVLLDLGLPDIDGVDLLRSLRREGIEVPVIVVTARSEVEVRRQCEQLGAASYLVKPFAFADLLTRIGDVAAAPGA